MGIKGFSGRISNEDVVEIRRLHSCGWSVDQLHGRWQIGKRAITKIVNGDSYKYLLPHSPTYGKTTKIALHPRLRAIQLIDELLPLLRKISANDLHDLVVMAIKSMAERDV